MSAFDVDAYTPNLIAHRVEEAGIAKANFDFLTTLILAILAGAFIAFGAILFTFVVHDSVFSYGVTRLLGGVSFCLGLILVVVAGAELFTGNNLLVMALVSRKITLLQLLRNWTIVFVGNFIGALGMVTLMFFSGHWLINDATIGATTLIIAANKVDLGFMQAFSLGILCNALVCLAVWLCYSCHSVTDKILAIIFPITGFVALGFEHSIANMYFISAGLAIKNIPEAVAYIETLFGTAPDLSNLTIKGFLINNLLPVTLGNIIGGSFFVGVVYWFIYLKNTVSEK